MANYTYFSQCKIIHSQLFISRYISNAASFCDIQRSSRTGSNIWKNVSPCAIRCSQLLVEEASTGISHGSNWKYQTPRFDIVAVSRLVYIYPPYSGGAPPCELVKSLALRPGRFECVAKATPRQCCSYRRTLISAGRSPRLDSISKTCFGTRHIGNYACLSCSYLQGSFALKVPLPLKTHYRRKLLSSKVML